MRKGKKCPINAKPSKQIKMEKRKPNRGYVASNVKRP